MSDLAFSAIFDDLSFAFAAFTIIDAALSIATIINSLTLLQHK